MSENINALAVRDPEERIQAIMDGVRRAYMGINDTDKMMAIRFSVEFARKHRYFEGGDILSAWRECADSRHKEIANKDWRNKWGAFITSLSTINLISPVGRIKPKNKQSHNNSAVLWESNIYVGDEPTRVAAYEELARMVKAVTEETLSIKRAIWDAYKHGVEQ
jgi:hypothetical protein